MYTALENYTHLHIATVNKTKSHCMECNALALQVYKIYKCCLHPVWVIGHDFAYHLIKNILWENLDMEKLEKVSIYNFKSSVN